MASSPGFSIFCSLHPAVYKNPVNMQDTQIPASLARSSITSRSSNDDDDLPESREKIYLHPAKLSRLSLR